MSGFLSLLSDSEIHREAPPPRTLGISLFALAAAGMAALLRPEAGGAGQFWGLLWLLALIPPFLLSYYRGWMGAVIALGIGMVVLTGTEVVGGTLTAGAVDWWIYGLATVGLIFVSLGAGITSEALHRAGGDPAGAEARQLRRREIQRAIDEGELVLHYQPIVRLATGEVAGLEALVRWNHPRRGMTSPQEFISFAESADLIVPLGNWVLEEALGHYGRWRDRFASESEHFFLSVNLSVRQVQASGFREDLRKVLRRFEMDPDALQLEVTESTVLEAGSQIEQLGDLGVRVAIDDFGKGYSSLSYLSRLEVDGLKVDSGFVDGMVDDEGDLAIVRSVVQLARSLEMEVTAEGVETGEQRDLLMGLECDFAQGFYFSEPFPVTALGSQITVGD